MSASETAAEIATDFSLIIPVHNEAENIRDLASEVESAMSGFSGHWEVIWVDDSSSDRTLQTLLKLSKFNSRHRVISLSSRYGQSAAVLAGVHRSTSPVLATIDGDGQCDPMDIPLLYQSLFASDLLLAQGIRQAPESGFARKGGQSIANWFRKLVFGVSLCDLGCATRVFKREAVEGLPAFKGFHRFFPVLVALRWPKRVAEFPVHHRPRLRGQSKYGFWTRACGGLYDFLGVFWIKGRGAIPSVFYDSKAGLLKPDYWRPAGGVFCRRTDSVGAL